jgi:FtsH-binding integral membrane protein
MTTSSSDHTASTFAPEGLARSSAVTGGQARAVFGQVMGLVAARFGFLALGAYVGRDLSGGLGIVFFLAAFACLIGLNIASGRSRQHPITLLFGFGLLLGLALGPVTNAYAKTDPSAVWQAAGATGAFVAALSAIGYATRGDLSSWARVLFWAGTTIFDFNRLRRTGIDDSVPIAASIFLDILNVFLLLLGPRAVRRRAQSGARVRPPVSPSESRSRSQPRWRPPEVKPEFER